MSKRKLLISRVLSPAVIERARRDYDVDLNENDHIMGAVWRCFAKLCTPSATSPWTCTGYDYVFDTASGFLVGTPGSQRVTLGGTTFKLKHPEGWPTCFPSHSGRVKVTRISADGWVRRELLGLWLYPGRSIVARFSDGSETIIATAAPARSAAILAA